MLRKRLPAIVLALFMTVLFPMTLLAAERDAPESDRAADRVHDGVSDETVEPDVDPLRDRVRDRVTDRPIDREVDRCVQERVDRRCPSDHEVDRCHHVADNDRRCIDHKPHDVNVRKLIWRLIHAQEWEKLFRLLLRLGIL